MQKFSYCLLVLLIIDIFFEFAIPYPVNVTKFENASSIPAAPVVWYNSSRICIVRSGRIVCSLPHLPYRISGMSYLGDSPKFNDLATGYFLAIFFITCLGTTILIGTCLYATYPCYQRVTRPVPTEDRVVFWNYTVKFNPQSSGRFTKA